MDVETGVQSAYFALFTNTKNCFYLCRNKLYNIHFSVVLSVGIQSLVEEGNIYIKGSAFYRHGEEVGFPAMTM